MDFRKLARALPASNNSAEGTEQLTLTDLPSNILEVLIPGYSVISRAISSSFGFDISAIVSICLVLFAATKGGRYLFQQAENAFRGVFMSSVHIDEHDDLFEMVMGWLAEHQGPTSRRSVRAKTQRGSVETEGAPSDALNENGLFDYTRWAARTPPRFEPYYGRNMFWHRGRLFFFRRAPKPSTQRVNVSFNSSADDDILQLDCIGRSTEPIRELLRSIKIWSLNRLRNTTTIRHPTPKDRSRFGGAWSKTFSRPSRPMETVILDVQQKGMIIKDMNEYLHPASPKWYATRGIPYRRGYLFHGPPGTGKTSLSFALAGIFGLDIYAISLQEPTLTEGDLMQLFNGLPARCIVLLEDVDAAGLLRDSQSDEKSSKGGKDDSKKAGEGKEGDATNAKQGEKAGGKGKEDDASSKDEQITVKDLVRELRKPVGKTGPQAGGHPNRAPGTGISLSGLLNAIDGVATHEGRVLIMTTNHPEKLDAALVRPGRVDRRVAFTLAKREQIRELFVRMYAAGEPIADIELHLSNILVNGSANGNAARSDVASISQQKPDVGPSRIELEDMAAEFAALIPDDVFTPAEIQNLLMMYKKEPRVAIDHAESWAKDLMAEKEQISRDKAKAEEEDED